MGNFDDIRPYNDEEVRAVINLLLNDKDFLRSVSGLKLPLLKKTSGSLANLIIKKVLKNRFEKINSIADVQDVVSIYVKDILQKSSDGVTASGLRNLSDEKGYLFVSNHRDIAMDPALISYLLHNSNLRTVEIAIGDNLLKKNFVSHLMRLNKSFIVKRSAIGREKLLATINLSKYIHFSVNSGNNVWIAQKEGRAKDGNDKTDPTIIKMFHIGKKDLPNKPSIKEVINDLNIIPVSISYEYDPCEEMKAKELYSIDNKGYFSKNDQSDLESISAGINGNKGRIHLSFGTTITAKSEDATFIAKQVDEQIISNYKLFPSNYLAYEYLQKIDPEIGNSLDTIISDMSEINSKREEFENRLSKYDEKLKSYIIKMYANSVISAISIKDKSQL